MKRLLLLLFPVMLITFSCRFGAPVNKDAEQVRNTFEEYKKALLESKGEEALQYVDRRTFQYYDRMLGLAKTASPDRVDALPITDKMLVLSIRNLTTLDQIRSFDGEALFAYAIKIGLVGTKSLENASIGEVTINRNLAKGEVKTNGKKSPIAFNFYRDRGFWKIDVASIIPATNEALKKMLQENGQDENQFILTTLEQSTGKKPGPNVWERMR